MLNKLKNSNFEIEVENQKNRAQELGIKIITDTDVDYPHPLYIIEDRPRVIYQKGSYIDDDNLSIAIVGSRKVTAYGKWASEKFAKELADIGVTVISGLAHGVDRVAHLSTLEAGGRTIAVLGNGIDNIYPKSNRSIYESIPSSGCLISEFPLGTQPLNYHFPMRNRIISGLSLAVIVIEAQEKSGSLITSSHAINQGKDVFAVPGNINSLYSKGTNLLIRDGAIPLLDIDDILREIDELKIKRNNKKFEEVLNIPLSESEIKIVNELKTGPLHCDILSLNTGMNIQTVISIIMILEIKGVVRETGSRIFMLN
jgi:DNA processing protein